MELTIVDKSKKTAHYGLNTGSYYESKEDITFYIPSDILSFAFLMEIKDYDIQNITEPITKLFTHCTVFQNTFKITRFMSQLTNYPPSLNRTLILGALEYVSLVQKKLDKIKLEIKKHFGIVKLIEKYLDAVQQKLETKKDKFDSININDTEGIFKKIEDICSQEGILPRIEEENIDLSNFYK